MSHDIFKPSNLIGCLENKTADSAQTRKRAIVTRPFPSPGGRGLGTRLSLSMFQRSRRPFKLFRARVSLGSKARNVTPAGADSAPVASGGEGAVSDCSLCLICRPDSG